MSLFGSRGTTSPVRTFDPTFDPDNVDPNYRGVAFDTFLDIIATNDYRLISRDINTDGTQENSEVYRRGNMVVHIRDIGRTIARDGKIYDFIAGLDGFYILSDMSDSFFGNPEDETEGITFSRKGMTEFNGRMTHYERYIFADGDIKYFFFDGALLVGTRINSTLFESTTDTIIYALDNNVPDDVFEIPEGYQEFDFEEHEHLVD